MAGYRFWLQSSLAVVLTLATVQVGSSQSPPATAYWFPEAASKPAVSNSPTCKIYSLSDLGDDPKLCKWVADTIPEMIQPASWKQAEVKISYYAPSKILVVRQTPAVHAQVDEFLQNMRKSLPQAKATGSSGVAPAQFTVPDGTHAYGPVQTGPSSYPVPFAPQTPKHLFHFIIRYEGEGIIDSNVVKFAKALKEEKAVTETPKVTSESNVSPPPPTSGTIVPAGGAAPYGPATGPTVLPAIPQAPSYTAPTNVPRMPPADSPPPPTSEGRSSLSSVPPTGTKLPPPPLPF